MCENFACDLSPALRLARRASGVVGDTATAGGPIIAVCLPTTAITLKIRRVYSDYRVDSVLSICLLLELTHDHNLV